MHRLPVLIFVCSVVAIAGCGGNDSAAPPDPTAHMTPGEILDRAHDVATGVKSFQVDIAATVRGTPRAGGTPTALEALIARPVEVSVKGRAQRPHAMSMDAGLRSETLPLALTLIQSAFQNERRGRPAAKTEPGGGSREGVIAALLPRPMTPAGDSLQRDGGRGSF